MTTSHSVAVDARRSVARQSGIALDSWRLLLGPSATSEKKTYEQRKRDTKRSLSTIYPYPSIDQSIDLSLSIHRSIYLFISSLHRHATSFFSLSFVSFLVASSLSFSKPSIAAPPPITAEEPTPPLCLQPPPPACTEIEVGPEWYPSQVAWQRYNSLVHSFGKHRVLATCSTHCFGHRRGTFWDLIVNYLSPNTVVPSHAYGVVDVEAVEVATSDGGVGGGGADRRWGFTVECGGK